MSTLDSCRSYLYLSMILLADATGSIASSATSELASGLAPRLFRKRKTAPPTAATVNTVETSCKGRTFLSVHSISSTQQCTAHNLTLQACQCFPWQVCDIRQSISMAHTWAARPQCKPSGATACSGCKRHECLRCHNSLCQTATGQ